MVDAMQTEKILLQNISSTPRNSRGYRRFSSDLRRDMLTYASSERAKGRSLQAVAETLGVGDSLLSRWLKDGTPASPLVPVRIASPKRRFVLEGPGGFRVNDLDIDDLVSLVQAADARQHS